MGYDDHAEVSTERSANDKWFNIFGIFIARVVTLCFRVNGCAGFFGRIFMFLKYSLKTVMFPYLQKVLAISIEGFIWQMYFFFACPPNLGFFLLLAYFFPIEVFSFNRGPVYHRQILFKGLKAFTSVFIRQRPSCCFFVLLSGTLKRPQNWSWRYRVVPSLWLWRVTSPGRVLLCQSSGVASLGHRVNLVISGWRNWHRFHRAGQGRSHNVLLKVPVFIHSLIAPYSTIAKILDISSCT